MQMFVILRTYATTFVTTVTDKLKKYFGIPCAYLMATIVALARVLGNAGQTAWQIETSLGRLGIDINSRTGFLLSLLAILGNIGVNVGGRVANIFRMFLGTQQTEREPIELSRRAPKILYKFLQTVIVSSGLFVALNSDESMRSLVLYINRYLKLSDDELNESKEVILALCMFFAIASGLAYLANTRPKLNHRSNQIAHTVELMQEKGVITTVRSFDKESYISWIAAATTLGLIPPSSYFSTKKAMLDLLCTSFGVAKSIEQCPRLPITVINGVSAFSAFTNFTTQLFMFQPIILEFIKKLKQKNNPHPATTPVEFKEILATFIVCGLAGAIDTVMNTFLNNIFSAESTIEELLDKMDLEVTDSNRPYLLAVLTAIAAVFAACSYFFWIWNPWHSNLESYRNRSRERSQEDFVREYLGLPPLSPNAITTQTEGDVEDPRLEETNGTRLQEMHHLSADGVQGNIEESHLEEMNVPVLQAVPQPIAEHSDGQYSSAEDDEINVSEVDNLIPKSRSCLSTSFFSLFSKHNNIRDEGNEEIIEDEDVVLKERSCIIF